MNWDDVPNLSDMGYQLYQSEDGTTWHNVSMKYNKPIKVLNVYPELAESNTLEAWMSGTGDGELNFVDSEGTPYIQVDPVSILTYNESPDDYLKDSAGNYKYDVIMFGSWDNYNGEDLSTLSYQATRDFSNTGRGILFGHDTVISTHGNLAKFSDSVGVSNNLFSIGLPPRTWKVSSEFVQLIDDGYLMKYPFKMEEGQILKIPYSHNAEVSNKNIGRTWLEFVDPNGTWKSGIRDNGTWRSGWYLKTNNNFAMIQTGHSNGASTLDERKIIANTLYNLSQVSMENNAMDYTVKDDVAPEIPSVKLKCGTKDAFSVHITSEDFGKKYQWYVTANTTTSGTKTSDIVEEEVISDIQGYIYTIDNSETTVPTVTKDEYGNVTNINASVELPNRTASVYGIDAKNNKYMHVVAVDRANNVSEVQHIELATLDHYINYEIERTGDEAKIVELELDPTIDNKMQSIEIQIPQNTEIKDFSSLTLPTGWFSYQNSDPNPAYQSFGFSMTTTTNDISTIQDFLESLRFTISSPTDKQGNIRILFHEKIVTSWNEHPDGKIHYYAFIPEAGNIWMKDYNLAKKQKYKGLTGYLATITSAEEHDFIYNNIARHSGWLGGVRQIKADGSKILDDSSISENKSDYIINASQANVWYWTDGPEAGTIFLNGPTYAYKAPEGVYEGFAYRQPDNGGSKESVLEFALQGTSKYWNDLPMDYFNEIQNLGYYAEFSEYGSQEEAVAEDTDLCWSAPIPQKVSLKAYDEEGASVSEGDILYDQELRIGKEITVTPTVLAMYDFKELRNADDTLHNPMVYTVEDTLQEGKLIYTNRKVSIHIRQVVTDPNAKVVVPTSGYGTIYNKAIAGGTSVQNFSVRMGGDQSEATQVFSDYVIRSNTTEKYFSYEAILPEYYQLLGYVVSTEVPVSGTSTEHKVANASTTVPTVDISENPEFWITTYITPTTETPSFYGWGYGQSEKYQTVE